MHLSTTVNVLHFVSAAEILSTSDIYSMHFLHVPSMLYCPIVILLILLNFCIPCMPLHTCKYYINLVYFYYLLIDRIMNLWFYIYIYNILYMPIYDYVCVVAF